VIRCANDQLPAPPPPTRPAAKRRSKRQAMERTAAPFGQATALRAAAL
jgi:hypothetical protein